MTALTAPRITPSLATGKDAWTTHPCAANKKVYPGAQVGLNASGNLVPATTTPSLKILGVASPKGHQLTRFGPAQTVLGYIDTTDLAEAAVECTVQRCVALMKNEGSAITKADIGADCYAVDDQTVHKTNGSTAGTSQITRGDVVFNGTDLVGVTVDGYTVSVNSVTDDDTTLAALVAKWNADPVAKLLAVATGDTSGAESWLYLAFLDTAAHTVVEYSPATAGVVTITHPTTNVAATAATRSRAGKIHDIDTRGVWVEYDAA